MVVRGEALCNALVPGLGEYYPKTRRLAPLVCWCLHVAAYIVECNIKIRVLILFLFCFNRQSF